MTDRTLVPIHVQTTDDEAEAAIDVVGVALPSTCRLFAVAPACADGDDAPPSIDDGLREAAARPVRCSVHEDERGLLAALSRFGHDRVVRTAPVLVTDDGGEERDAPVCWAFRNRAARIDPACPFVGLPYADVAPIADALGTGEDARGRAAPEAASERFLGDDRSAVDAPPASADDAEARTGPLLARTLAELLRTDALLAAARQSSEREDESDRTRSDGAPEPAQSDDGPRRVALDGTPRLVAPDGTPRLTSPNDGGPR